MKQEMVFNCRLVFRLAVAITAIILYFYQSELLDFTAKQWSWFIWFYWIILLGDLLIRFVPGKHHHFGMQKHLNRNFKPTEKYLNLQSGKISESAELMTEVKKQNRGAWKSFIAFILLNAIVYTLYFTGIFRPQEMMLVLLFYYVGDMICATIFCPFRTLFMKNRCCTACRIYSWDSSMLILPVMFVFSFFSTTLGVIALIHTSIWEITYHRHPERYLESCNENISCKNCKDQSCPRKRKAKIKKFFRKK